MNDHLKQVGNNIISDYYDFLNLCLEGANEAFIPVETPFRFAQLEQDIGKWQTLEYQFHQLETQLNATLNPVAVVDTYPPASQVVSNSEMPGIQNLPFIRKTGLKNSPSVDFPATVDKPATKRTNPNRQNLAFNPQESPTEKASPQGNFNAKTQIEKDLLNQANKQDDFFINNQTSQPQVPKQTTPPLPQSNEIKRNIYEYPQTIKTPKTEQPNSPQHREHKDTPPQTLTQNTTSKFNQTLGGLSDFAQQFNTQKNETNAPGTQTTSKAQKANKVTPPSYEPPPKNLQAFTELLSKKITPQSENPTLRLQQNKEHQQQDQDIRPTAAKLDVEKNMPLSQNPEQEIKAFTEQLTNNPAFIHRYFSTDNKPLPPEVDYDELMENLAKHLYWEYKRYYGK